MQRPDYANEGGPKANFSIIRYAQCWEDADVLLAGLDVRPGDVCLSIGSGGENSLSLLTCDPARVIAVDLSLAQIACLELKVAGYRHLTHGELLELIGASPSTRRPTLYDKLRKDLSSDSLDFWDAHTAEIAAGIGSAGKFERYFSLFRRYVLPLIHSQNEVDALFQPHSLEARKHFYDTVWNNWRWRLLFKAFISRPVMARLGRDPSFFKYVQGSVAGRILEQVKHALTELDPSDNPYLQWIIYGHYTTALPHALRPKNFPAIRDRIDRIEWRQATVERVLSDIPEYTIDRFNMSDIFEYLSPDESDSVFTAIARTGRTGGRVAYWSMLAPRRFPDHLGRRFKPIERQSRQLHFQAQTCFYSAFYVDELI
jgi:S-adenosylmethionine-diacylglycerol 3-amino-3-carboxypropyl transferase